MLEAMEALGVSWWRRNLIWAALRVGRWWARGKAGPPELV
jgi:hypothetical protein